MDNIAHFVQVLILVLFVSLGLLKTLKANASKFVEMGKEILMNVMMEIFKTMMVALLIVKYRKVINVLEGVQILRINVLKFNT